MEKHFLNLTNGIEALEREGLNLEEVSFIRLQSCHCEAHQWDSILREIDYNFLMSLALGYKCYVYDFGANANSSKAAYFGLEWIRYVLNRRWLNIDYIPVVKGKKVTNYFENEYEKITKFAKKRIDYFRKYLFTDEIIIIPVTSATRHDNQPDYFKRILTNSLKK